MISAGRASNFEIEGGIVLGGSECSGLIALAVAADSLTVGGESVEDKEVEEDLRSPMSLSIFNDASRSS